MSWLDATHRSIWQSFLQTHTPSPRWHCETTGQQFRGWVWSIGIRVHVNANRSCSTVGAEKDDPAVRFKGTIQVMGFVAIEIGGPDLTEAKARKMVEKNPERYRQKPVESIVFNEWESFVKTEDDQP